MKKLPQVTVVRTRSGHVPKGPPSLRSEALYRSATAFSQYVHTHGSYPRTVTGHVDAPPRVGRDPRAKTIAGT